MTYIIKVALSAFLIVLITEVSKVNTIVGGLIKSLPLISILSIIWLYVDQRLKANLQLINVDCMVCDSNSPHVYCLI